MEGLTMEGASAEDFAEHVANKIQKYGYLLLSVTCSFSCFRLMVKSQSFKSDRVKGICRWRNKERNLMTMFMVFLHGKCLNVFSNG